MPISPAITSRYMERFFNIQLQQTVNLGSESYSALVPQFFIYLFSLMYRIGTVPVFHVEIGESMRLTVLFVFLSGLTQRGPPLARDVVKQQAK